jgi:hypothetical protein
LNEELGGTVIDRKFPAIIHITTVLDGALGSHLTAASEGDSMPLGRRIDHNALSKLARNGPLPLGAIRTDGSYG